MGYGETLSQPRPPNLAVGTQFKDLLPMVEEEVHTIQDQSVEVNWMTLRINGIEFVNIMVNSIQCKIHHGIQVLVKCSRFLRFLITFPHFKYENLPHALYLIL